MARLTEEVQAAGVPLSAGRKEGRKEGGGEGGVWERKGQSSGTDVKKWARSEAQRVGCPGTRRGWEGGGGGRAWLPFTAKPPESSVFGGDPVSGLCNLD